ncbi:hypothetical protein [Thiomicrorhabdus xiamenensis]|uniref:Lipoprotein n=1 Tax=Thiomicrorhabdus xiamenensis TaxID=2739063 RepID=A0A7D4NLC6_9GAMM|nr:hypothetical protein [Thiomicrorhabdus xiamenensis]QKI89054.1 hypothetical protein HQN79_05445 [Thiomicrorhabdus xiamenensis]
MIKRTAPFLLTSTLLTACGGGGGGGGDSTDDNQIISGGTIEPTFNLTDYRYMPESSGVAYTYTVDGYVDINGISSPASMMRSVEASEPLNVKDTPWMRTVRTDWTIDSNGQTATQSDEKIVFVNKTTGKIASLTDQFSYKAGSSEQYIPADSLDKVMTHNPMPATANYGDGGTLLINPTLLGYTTTVTWSLIDSGVESEAILQFDTQTVDDNGLTVFTEQQKLTINESGTLLSVETSGTSEVVGNVSSGTAMTVAWQLSGQQ